MATREQILGLIRVHASSGPRLVKIDVPEWDTVIWVRKLPFREKLALERRLQTIQNLPEDDDEARARWHVQYVIESALDEQGKPLFSSEDERDLLTSDGTAIERIAVSAMRVNTVRQEELANLGKESVRVLNGALPSSSPATSA